MNNLFLIDGNALCYWNIISYKDPNIPDNEYRKVIIFQFISKLKSWLKMLPEGKCIFFWDTLVNHRKEIYTTYKAQRKKEIIYNGKNIMPIFYPQMNALISIVLPRMGFQNIFSQNGFEADDLIAFAVRRYYKTHTVYVVSRDSDMYQLLDYDNVCCFWSKKKYTRRHFAKEFEIRPNQYVEYKAIAGDSADNIKGVPGVGKKGAIDFLKGRINKKSKAYQLIIEHEQVRKKYEQIITIPLKTEQYHVKPFRLKEETLYQKDFMDIFEELQFKSFLSSETFQGFINVFNLI